MGVVWNQWKIDSIIVVSSAQVKIGLNIGLVRASRVSLECQKIVETQEKQSLDLRPVLQYVKS